MSDLSEQLTINLEINRLIAQRNVILTEQAQITSQQIDLQRILCEAMECSLDENAITHVENIREAMLDAADAAREYLDSSERMRTSIGRMADEELTRQNNKISEANIKLKENARNNLLATAAMNALMWTIKKFTNVFNGLISVAKSVASGVFDAFKFLLSIPFQVNSMLIKTANQVIDISPVSLALEEVRKQFGDLNVSTGAIIKDGFRPMKSEFNQLAAAGHGFTKTFGYGREGLAAAIKFNAELFGALKGGSYELRKEIGENVAEHAIYRKALGMTAEQQANLIHMAKQQGKSATEVQQEYSKFAITMGKRFGFSAKELGSDMAAMAADVKNFSTIGPAGLSKVAVYTKQLGIEWKQLLGLVDKYDNFEDAAKSVSMLNQSFGMQLDVLKMMRMENPADRLREVQNAFMATGRSYDALSRVERKRLADLTGLDEAAARAAFSQQGLNMSYDEIVGAADDTENSTMSLNTTMKELSKNIERILKLGKTFDGFLDAFMQGMEYAFTRSKEGWKLLANIRKALTTTFWAAGAFMRKIMEIQEVQSIIENLTKFYSPENFRKLFDRLFPVFSRFIDALSDPTKAHKAFQALWSGIREAFKEHFKELGIEQLDKSIGSLAVKLGNAAIAFAEEMTRQAAKFLRVVTRILNPNEPSSFVQIIQEEFGANVGEKGGIFDSLFANFEQNFGENLGRLGNVVKNELKPTLISAFQSVVDALIPVVKSMMLEVAPIIASELWSAFTQLDLGTQTLVALSTGIPQAAATGALSIGSTVATIWSAHKALKAVQATTAAVQALSTAGTVAGAGAGAGAGAAGLGAAGVAGVGGLAAAALPWILGGAAVAAAGGVYYLYADSVREERLDNIGKQVGELYEDYDSMAVEYARKELEKKQSNLMFGTVDEEDVAVFTQQKIKEFYQRQGKNWQAESAKFKENKELQKQQEELQHKLQLAQTQNVIKQMIDSYEAFVAKIPDTRKRLDVIAANLEVTKRDINGLVTRINEIYAAVIAELNLLNAGPAFSVAANNLKLIADGFDKMNQAINLMDPALIKDNDPVSFVNTMGVRFQKVAEALGLAQLTVFVKGRGAATQSYAANSMSLATSYFGNEANVTYFDKVRKGIYHIAEYIRMANDSTTKLMTQLHRASQPIMTGDGKEYNIEGLKQRLQSKFRDIYDATKGFASASMNFYNSKEIQELIPKHALLFEYGGAESGSLMKAKNILNAFANFFTDIHNNIQKIIDLPAIYVAGKNEKDRMSRLTEPIEQIKAAILELSEQKLIIDKLLIVEQNGANKFDSAIVQTFKDWVYKIAYIQETLDIFSYKSVDTNALRGAMANLEDSFKIVSTAKMGMDETTVQGLEVVKKTVDYINEIQSDIKQLALPGPLKENLRVMVDLNNSLKGGRELTLKHQNLQINLGVRVNIEAKNMVEEIVKVQDLSNNRKIGWNIWETTDA